MENSLKYTTNSFWYVSMVYMLVVGRMQNVFVDVWAAKL